MSTCAARSVRPVNGRGGPARRNPPPLRLVRQPVRRGRQPVRLTRRGRLVLVAFFALLALTLSFLVLRESSVATNRSGEARYRTVVVEPGQTLWQIARAADPEADPRVTVARIIKFNALPSAVVQPGQRIAVPEH